MKFRYLFTVAVLCLPILTISSWVHATSETKVEAEHKKLSPKDHRSQAKQRLEDAKKKKEDIKNRHKQAEERLKELKKHGPDNDKTSM